MNRADLKVYKKDWANRPVCLERGLDVASLAESACIVEPLRFHGWDSLFASPGPCNLNMVREFFMSLKTDRHVDGILSSTVRGRDIVVTVGTIATTLGVPTVDDPGYPVPVTAPRISDETVAAALLIDPARMLIRPWKVSRLKLHYRILLRFALASIYPRLRVSDCSETIGHMLYHIMHRTTFNLPAFIFDNISHVKSPNPSSNTLPHGCLVTRFCMDSGVLVNADDKIEYPLRALNAMSEGRSKGQGFSGEDDAGGSSAGGSARPKRRRATAGPSTGQSVPVGPGGFDMAPFMTSLQQYFTPQFAALGGRFTGLEARMGGVEDRMTHLETEVQGFRADFQTFIAGGGRGAGQEASDDEPSAESTDEK